MIAPAKSAPAKSADGLVEALRSSWIGDTLVRAGDTRRDDDPLVAAHPGLFVPADLTSDEKRAIAQERSWARIDRRGEPRAPKSGPPVGVPFSELGQVSARHRFQTREGRDVRSGERFDAGDPIPMTYPHLFVPVVAPTTPAKGREHGIPVVGIVSRTRRAAREVMGRG